MSEEKKPEDAKKEWDEMVQAVKDHACGARVIEAHDNVLKLELGFKCAGCDEEWLMHLCTIKTAMDAMEEEERETFRMAIGTEAGRKEMAASFN
jgi:hypothetical protein